MSKLIKICSYECDKYCKKENNDNKLNEVLNKLNKLVDGISSCEKSCNESNDINKVIDSLTKILEKIDGCKEDSDNSNEINHLIKIIDKLGQTITEFNCCKKIVKELEKLKNQLKAEYEKQLKDLEDRCKDKMDQQIKNLEEKHNQVLKDLKTLIDKERWVIGEYRWMPIGSVMPEGWVKVDIAKGYTLVQGTQAGTTSGSNKKHNHQFQNNVMMLGISESNLLYYVNRPGTSAGVDFTPVIKDTKKVFWSRNTDFDGGDSNLAAGIFAELWQFQGTEEKQKKFFFSYY